MGNSSQIAGFRGHRIKRLGCVLRETVISALMLPSPLGLNLGRESNNILIPNSQFPTPSSQPPTPNSQLPTPNFQFPTPNSQLPIPNSQFPTPNSQFPIPNSQFPTPNSQLPIPNSQFPIPPSPFNIHLIGAYHGYLYCRVSRSAG